jgi:hypothetical protein
MRNRVLHDALRDFALEVAALLQDTLKSGAEVEFELEGEPGSGGTLYRYRALTNKFIDERWQSLRALPSCERAAETLGAGASAYLRLQGVPGVDAEPALRAMLDRLYPEVTSFEFPEERFEQVYAEVERTLYDGTLPATVIAALPGLEIERDRVDLGDGLSLQLGELVADAPPEAIWADPRERDGDPYTLCVLDRDIRTDQPLPITEARIRFKRVLTAMRLFKPGAVTLGPLAWSRADEGAWQPVSLGGGAQLRGEPWLLMKAEEPDLSELVDLLARARHSGSLGWALSRFEMGCERAQDTEALSDYLLALRALLDGHDDTGRASLALRLAALCAEESERRPMQRRVELAFALERFVIGGGNGEAYVDEIGSDSPRDLVLEVEESVRALLRDVLCGYLDPDLKHAADDILLRSSEPVEIKAQDNRRWSREARSQVTDHRSQEEHELDPEPDPEPELEAEVPQPEPELPEPPEEPDTDEFELVEEDEELAAGVTPSADWDLDDDPGSYSAPV